MKVSYVIMMHPKRRQNLSYLQDKLGSVPVIFDRKNNIWDTAKRAWDAHDRKSEYAVTVQDDALLCNNFTTLAAKMMQEDVVYNFFMGKKPAYAQKIQECKRMGRPFLKNKTLQHECCFGMRTERIDNMIAFCQRYNPTDDSIIDRYIKSNRLPVWFAMPSLASHRDNKSLNRPWSFPKGAAWWIQ